jgi:hypothetical protein
MLPKNLRRPDFLLGALRWALGYYNNESNTNPKSVQNTAYGKGPNPFFANNLTLPFVDPIALRFNRTSTLKASFVAMIVNMMLAQMTSTSPPRVGTLKRLLSGHPYFGAWDDTQLKQLEGHCRLLELPQQSCLLEQEAVDPEIHFLLEGRLRLMDAEGQERFVAAKDPDASFPVSRLRPSRFRVVAEIPSLVFAVEQSMLRRHAQKPPKARFKQGSRATGGSWQQHPLVREVVASAKAGTLQLPVIPGVALKVRRALAKEDFNLDQISQIIAADPVISAKLIRLANSALFPGAQTCSSVQTAVVRLGVSKVQNVVLALSSATLFDSEHPALRTYLVKVWRHLVQVGALSAALARRNGEMDMDLVMLSGLLHEIGKIPILEMATRREDLWANPGLLEDIL